MAKYKMVADGMPVFEGDEYWDSERGWLPVVPYYGRPAPRGTLVRRPWQPHDGKLNLKTMAKNVSNEPPRRSRKAVMKGKQ